jgi:hypothetical protein
LALTLSYARRRTVRVREELIDESVESAATGGFAYDIDSHRDMGARNGV